MFGDIEWIRLRLYLLHHLTVTCIITILFSHAVAVAETSRITIHGPRACESIFNNVPIDPHTFANYQEFIVKHIDLNLSVDFKNQQLHGVCRLELTEQLRRPNPVMILDTRDLRIKNVHDEHGQKLFWELGTFDGIKGTPLYITLKPDSQKISIEYSTGPHAPGLQWLKREMTDGRAPFLFTVSQPIHARSWIPLQDTPSVKTTWSARITTPKDLKVMALMSGHNRRSRNLSTGVYRFDKYDKAVPSYLIALVVGDLRFRQISDRVGLYAEPAVIDKAYSEFEEAPRLLTAAEKIMGPYDWNRLDFLVMPKSFPYGGMENPELIYLTQTLLVGDKSEISVAAHEIGHSWIGNTVTNGGWKDFFLNEGMNRWIEFLILEEFDPSGKLADAERALSYQKLHEFLLREGESSEKTVLVPDLSGTDPDEFIGPIPYEKGYLFFHHVEQVVGRARLLNFLRGYVQDFAFKSITTEEFIQYMNEKLVRGSSGLTERLKVNEWLESPGLPSNHPIIESEYGIEVDQVAQKFKAAPQKAFEEMQNWSSPHQWKLFLKAVSLEPVDTQSLLDLDNRFGLSHTQNALIASPWFQLAVANGLTNHVQPEMEKYLQTVGRAFLITPIYKELAKTEAGKQVAKDIFAHAKGGYHPVVVKAIEKILN